MPPGGGPGRLRPCPLQTGPRWGGGAPASGRPGSGPTPRKGPGGGGVPASRRRRSGRRPGRLAAPSGHGEAAAMAGDEDDGAGPHGREQGRRGSGRRHSREGGGGTRMPVASAAAPWPPPRHALHRIELQVLGAGSGCRSVREEEGRGHRWPLPPRHGLQCAMTSSAPCLSLLPCGPPPQGRRKAISPSQRQPPHRPEREISEGERERIK